MIQREVIVWRENRLEKYLDGIEKNDKKEFDKLNSKIIKLKEHGEDAIDGNTIKAMKGYKIQYKILRIKPNNKHKPYRLYVLLSPQHLILIEGRDKKRNDMSKDLNKYLSKITKEVISQLDKK